MNILRKLRFCICWSWTYLWAVWFVLIAILLYVLRVPLKLNEGMSSVTQLFGSLTPKFYVALTGTSSLISGVVLTFEWWYYRKYGTSFLEQLSFARVPFFGSGSANDLEPNANGASTNLLSNGSVANGSLRNGHANGNSLCESHSADETGDEQCESDADENDDSDGNTPRKRCQHSDGRSRRPDEQSQTAYPGTFSLANQDVAECKVWRNPFALFRGPEYYRFETVHKRPALTCYDMQLSAQDHQTLFLPDLEATPLPAVVQQQGQGAGANEKGHQAASHLNNMLQNPPGQASEQELLIAAYRERVPSERVQKARLCLAQNSDYVPALVFLAEEEPTLISDVERQLRHALKFAESNYRKSASMQHYGGFYEAQHKANTNLLVYIKRRLAMCLRKLGRLRDAIKIMKDMLKEFPPQSALYSIQENLMEACLELQSISEVQMQLAKYDCITQPKSAMICYTAALLKARQVADRFSPDAASKRGLNPAELNAVEAIHRAVEFNPHVPKYLLEMKSLVLPGEHIQKRGDSEAIAYAFSCLTHWQRVDGALHLLYCTWEGTFRMIPYPLDKGLLFYPYPQCTEAVDRELLPAFHEVSVYPKRELPFFIVFMASLCSCTALLAIITHQFPDETSIIFKHVIQCICYPFSFAVGWMEALIPSKLLHSLISK